MYIYIYVYIYIYFTPFFRSKPLNKSGYKITQKQAVEFLCVHASRVPREDYPEWSGTPHVFALQGAHLFGRLQPFLQGHGGSPQPSVGPPWCSSSWVSG